MPAALPSPFRKCIAYKDCQ